MEKAVKDGSLGKAKVGELKEYLKAHKQPQTGEKDDLVLRVTLHVRSRGLKIDDKDPFELKPAELRKACAQRGLNPMGERDELLKMIIEAASSSDGGAGGTAADGDDEATKLVKKVLSFDGDAPAILSLLGTHVDASSTASVMRKQYLLLSTKIHPDKHPEKTRHLATKAFQVLVSAYDALSQPDMSQADTAKPKTKTINRSNEGCYRTAIYCPRCQAPWGENVDGLEPAAYSHMMTGIKTYCCSTCLLDFGCMTAIHKCPFCRKMYDYTPDDYHNKILCGNKGCARTFGFMLYNVSESRMKELREELKTAQEKRLKKMEGLARRNARATDKAGGAGEGDDDALQEEIKAFRAGLLDVCPKCGHKMGKRDGEDEAAAHLRDCKDSKKIQAYQRRKRIEAEAQALKKQKRAVQDEVTNMSSWEFLGGENENMWMLGEEGLRKLCAQYQLDGKGGKDELIARLVRHRNSLDSARLLTDEGGGSGTRAGKKASVPTHFTLPSNLESMSVSQLKSVAAAHGIEVSATSKQAIIACIEKERFRDEPQLRLTRTAENEEEEPPVSNKRKAPAGKKRGKAKALESDSDDDVSLLDLAPKGKKQKAGKARGNGSDDDDDQDFAP